MSSTSRIDWPCAHIGGPAGIELLQQRQQALGAQRQRAEHRDRAEQPAFAQAEHQGQAGDQHQAEPLDHEARRGANEIVRRLGSA